MNKRLLIFQIGFIFLFCLFSFCVAQGKHKGEERMLDVEITFSGAFGTTVTNSEGTYYNFLWGYTLYEEKVYPQQYWGEYPLYFFGLPVGVTVKITNKGPREKCKLSIKSEAFVLRTDGSSGAPLMVPKVVDVEVKRGETKVVDASFVCEYVDGADSGLDRFIVKVLHTNEGNGSEGNNYEPALIMQKEGVFCPPKYKNR
jgi:hypothetical protein